MSLCLPWLKNVLPHLYLLEWKLCLPLLTGLKHGSWLEQEAWVVTYHPSFSSFCTVSYQPKTEYPDLEPLRIVVFASYAILKLKTLSMPSSPVSTARYLAMLCLGIYRQLSQILPQEELSKSSLKPV